MDALKNKIKRSSPGLFHLLQSSRDFLIRAADWPGMAIHPWRLDSNHRLGQYQNRYTGKRCFVIGNGPSLKNTELSLLKDEYTFGMNRIYLAFEDLGFQTSFLVSVNDLVIEQCHQDFQRLSHGVQKIFCIQQDSRIQKHISCIQHIPVSNSISAFCPATGKARQ